MTVALLTPDPAAPTPSPAAIRPPTLAEIDELLEGYDSANRMLKAAKEVVEQHKAMCIFYADSFGAVPAHAEQSRRLEGKLHTLTVTRGTTIAVAEPAVLDLHLALTKAGCGELFSKLFTASTKHKLVKGATDTLRTINLQERLHQKVLALFGKCFKVDSNEPAVKVDMRVVEKTARKTAKKGGRA